MRYEENQDRLQFLRRVLFRFLGRGYETYASEWLRASLEFLNSEGRFFNFDLEANTFWRHQDGVTGQVGLVKSF